ncbi:hypothetical protein [Streptomyces sp. NPDC058718]|uniref:hypothetical protein n=1 Tax=Streptomyces sp. NPDC058718 TaxID=3346610 RepID=UPI003692DAF1
MRQRGAVDPALYGLPHPATLLQNQVVMRGGGSGERWRGHGLRWRGHGLRGDGRLRRVVPDPRRGHRLAGVDGRGAVIAVRGLRLVP